jgi:pimeloyl-ACP methyl ester carboxylesterase
LAVLLWVGIGILILAAAIVTVPLILPIPPIKDVEIPEKLADADSQFALINYLKVHYKDSGGSHKPVVVFLHGFGASLFSFNGVTTEFSKNFRVVAFDRIGFGLSQRPIPGEWVGENPYSDQSQVNILFGLLDHLGIQKAVLAGYSAGGAIAVQAAVQHPERVTGLVLEDPAIFGQGHGFSGGLRWLLDTPQAKRLMPYIIRRIFSNGDSSIRKAWHDPDKVTAETIEFYRRPLRVRDWDRASFEFTRAERTTITEKQLQNLDMPVLVLSGDDDTFIPIKNSQRLAEIIPQALFEKITACGHIPHEEQPAAFLSLSIPFIHTILEK